MNNVLHITNGDSLTEKFRELNLPGDLMVWREMLCEGPTVSEVGTEAFFNTRKRFLKDTYKIPENEYEEEFIQELQKLSQDKKYDEIILWFEFDLFSHMNMLALISLLMQNKTRPAIFLVCSGRLKGEEELLPLPQLSTKQLHEHYKCRIELNTDDLEMASLIWELYCGDKPNRLVSEIKKTSNFEYLSSCIRAHIERFPSTKSGLNTLEMNVLKLIEEHEISSVNQLLGYALEYQGYYGYGEPQMQRVLEKLRGFYTKSKKGIRLNPEGIKAVEMKENFYRKLKDDEFYGGVRKYDFLYDPDSHNLLKL